MHTDQLVLLRIADGVGRITLNRPGAGNALDLAMARAIRAAVDQVAQAGVRAVLLAAHGPMFCSGGDVRAFVAHEQRLDRFVQDILDTLHPAIATLSLMPVPVISALQGPIAGGGIGLALCADIVLASTRLKLRGGYAAIGLTPDTGSSFFLTRRAGPAHAKTAFLMNRPIGAEECLRWGIVDALYAPEELGPAAEKLASSLARGAAGAFGCIKRLCDEVGGYDVREHLALERQAILRRARRDDADEGIRAFVERRPPAFHDEAADCGLHEAAFAHSLGDR